MTLTRSGVWPLRRWRVQDSRFPSSPSWRDTKAQAMRLALDFTDGDARLIDVVS